MDILEHLDIDNLHHAYLIEDRSAEALPVILEFLANSNINILNNPDFFHISVDSIKIDDARRLKSMGANRGFDGAIGSKKIFIISTNSFLLEAQNTLLKMFEEPIEHTHFFLIMPDTDGLLPTFKSRFYFIPSNSNINTINTELKEAEKFVSMPLLQRIEFIKELITEVEDEEDAVSVDSARTKAQNFLNYLETVLHKKFFAQVSVSKVPFDTKKDFDFFEQIFQVRKYLRQPGSSTKSLMESVALSIPYFNYL